MRKKNTMKSKALASVASARRALLDFANNLALEIYDRRGEVSSTLVLSDLPDRLAADSPNLLTEFYRSDPRWIGGLFGRNKGWSKLYTSDEAPHAASHRRPVAVWGLQTA